MKIIVLFCVRPNQKYELRRERGVGGTGERKRVDEEQRLTVFHAMRVHTAPCTSPSSSSCAAGLSARARRCGRSAQRARIMRKSAPAMSVPTVAGGGEAGGGSVPFRKYHGLGNDFILVDNRGSDELLISEERAVEICDRHRGIGADGVIFLLPPNAVSVAAVSDAGEVHASMRVINSDGSEPEMCGNGIRCLAKFMDDIFIREKGLVGGVERLYNIATLAGLIRPRMMASGSVEVNMGPPILEPGLVPTTLPANFEAEGIGAAVVRAPITVSNGDALDATCVSMGNPHCLVYVKSLDALPFELLGPELEGNTDIFPAKTNVEFVEVVRRDYVRMKVWERGAGPTQACGTGACATVVAGSLMGETDNECTVLLPGGELHINWDRNGSNAVFMTGPAEFVFEGSV